MPIALLLALAASLGIHVGALILPDLELPGLGEEPPAPPLEARLMPPPAVPVATVAPKPAARAKPRPSRPARPVPPGPAAVPAPPAPPEPAAAAPEPQAVAEAPASAAPAAPRLPPRGRIRFAVFKGDQNFEVGQTIHEWQIADGAYQLSGITETTGLAALFKPVRVSYESRGRIGPAGLQPDSFVGKKNGVETGDRAEFDWAGGSITQGKDSRRQSLPAGAQDFISFYYEFGYLPQLGATVDLPVSTGRKLDTIRFTRVGEETLNLAFGAVPTLHLKAAGETTTEVWLATDRLLLPVKIRHIDKKGEIFDQVATELRVGDGPPAKE